MRLKNFIGAVFTVVLVFVLVSPGFSMMIGNTSGISFSEEGTDSSAIARTSSSSGIEDLVIKSATHFLQGKAHVNLLASRLEAADHDGVCFYEYQTIIDDALDNMKTARYYYQSLVNKANNTPYNQNVIDQLKNCDYESLSKEWGVNESSFNQIKNYLEAGDVRGAYVQLYTYTDNIVKMLETIQNDVYCWNFPETANIWNLNQECAQMLLFGQYMAQIFYQVY